MIFQAVLATHPVPPLGSPKSTDFMHARYFSSNLGRFLSVDPVGGEVGSSQSWNRYSYVMNRPLAGVDPDGMIGPVDNSYGDMWARAYEQGREPHPILAVAAVAGLAMYGGMATAPYVPEVLSLFASPDHSSVRIEKAGDPL